MNRATNKFRSLCALVWPCFGSRWRNDSGSNSVFRRGFVYSSALLTGSTIKAMESSTGSKLSYRNTYGFFSPSSFSSSSELSNYRSDLHDSKPKIIHCPLKLEQPVSSFVRPFCLQNYLETLAVIFLYEYIVSVAMLRIYYAKRFKLLVELF